MRSFVWGEMIVKPPEEWETKQRINDQKQNTEADCDANKRKRKS